MSFYEIVDALSAKFVSAHKRGDVAACAGAYSTDCVMLAPGYEAIRGRPAVTAVIAGLMKDKKTINRLVTQKAEVDGNIGYAIQTVEGDADSHPVLLVFRREKTGEWQVCAEAILLNPPDVQA
jgi:ketosteroid isomerase-like protein